MEFLLVSFAIAGIITLNAPEKLNALTVAMGDQFASVVSALKKDLTGIGAVVLTGSAPAFR
jgi:enoyl-CoA hydratase/carnithine racemase